MYIEKRKTYKYKPINILLQYSVISLIFINVEETTITINDTIYVENVLEKCSNLLCYFK